MLKFVLNNQSLETEWPPGRPVLDFLRSEAGLTGVKFACREGDCGSCAVLLGGRCEDGLSYQIVTSCLLPLGAVADRHVVTIEGLNRQELNPIQQAFVDCGASQCGFCTPGFIVSLTGYLLEAKEFRFEDAVEAIGGNICRCTGYASIGRAIDRFLGALSFTIDPEESRIEALVREEILPEYFLSIESLLANPSPAPPIPFSATRTIVGGGTDLYVQRPHEIENAPIFILPLPARPAISKEGGSVVLAATATAEDMKQSDILAESVGGIDRAMELMGSLPIRNRATIAGNLVNASPIGDMTIILLALGAEIGLAGGEERRIAPLHQFFLDYKKLDLRPGELLEWVRFEAGPEGRLFNFEKVSKRTHLDIATVNTAISLNVIDGRITGVRLAAGGVAPIPMRLQRTMDFLEGRPPTAETALAAAETARSEVSPITDVRGSADYKRLLLGQLVLAHFHVLFNVDPGQFAEASA
jgi:xanthine dehydrogenase small subunit